MDIITRDEDGNEFPCNVRVIESSHCTPMDYDNSLHAYAKKRKLVDFGYPMQYYLSDLMENYPFKRGLCIDAAGRNHKGSPVWVSKKDINHILEVNYK